MRVLKITALFVLLTVIALSVSLAWLVRTEQGSRWLLEQGHSILDSEQEPKMTRFLAEQLAMSHWFSKKKAERLLGYQEQVSTEVGMERLVAWLRRKGL